jgi:hypothetical protein
MTRTNDEHPTARLIERLFSAIGCGVFGAVAGVILMLAILYFTQPPVDLGWGPSFFSGGVVGAVVGGIFPRIGLAIGRVALFFLQFH